MSARIVTVAATQMSASRDTPANTDRAERLVRQAAAAGARVILLQELFETPYFCIEHEPEFLALATPLAGNALIARFAALARELGVVLPISWYERAGNTQFNSVAMIDADGEVLGTYRKTHIPEAIGYHEKFYFSPGDTGFRVWDTAHARVGVGICWDQWFPEAARCLALLGAEVILYPTAIGSEPSDDGFDSMPHWRNTMQGHAAANIVPVVASNRIGREQARSVVRHIDFYGSSFIADHRGELCAQADRGTESVLVHAFDLDAIAEYRRGWGVYRDRRPGCYAMIDSTFGVEPAQDPRRAPR